MSVVQIGTIFRRKNTKNRKNYPPEKLNCVYISITETETCPMSKILRKKCGCRELGLGLGTRAGSNVNVPCQDGPKNNIPALSRNLWVFNHLRSFFCRGMSTFYVRLVI